MAVDSKLHVYLKLNFKNRFCEITIYPFYWDFKRKLQLLPQIVDMMLDLLELSENKMLKSSKHVAIYI